MSAKDDELERSVAAGTTQARRPAVFLDRDGTVVEHVHHLHRVQDIQLIPGAGATIRTLRESGYACVIVTNQSVVGRGMIDEDELAEIHDEMHRQLAAEGAAVDAVYYCTVAPNTRDQSVVEHPDRKPAPGMLLKASDELSLDLANSWMVGDSWSDVLAGKNAGCRGSILVLTGFGRQTQVDRGYAPFAETIVEAGRLILDDQRKQA